MKHLLCSLSALLLLFGFLPETATAGGTGYSTYSSRPCALSKWSTPRYNQSLPFRHYEDHRRYNAAPCCNDKAPSDPYLLKTVVVRKKREPYYYYDSHGRRHCKRVLVTNYKDLYSNGACRVYTVRG